MTTATRPRPRPKYSLANFDKVRQYVWMTDAELAKAIGANVRAARQAAGLSQARLGRLTGLSVPNISRLEAGTHLPSVSTLKKVSDALKVSICSFLDPPKKR